MLRLTNKHEMNAERLSDFKERFLYKGSLGRFAAKTMIVVGISAPVFTMAAEHVVDHSRKAVADSFAQSAKPQFDNKSNEFNATLHVALEAVNEKLNNMGTDVDQAKLELHDEIARINVALHLPPLEPLTTESQQAAPTPTTIP